MASRMHAQKVKVFERVADGLHIPGHMLGIGRRPWETELPQVEDPDHSRGEVSRKNETGSDYIDGLMHSIPDLRLSAQGMALLLPYLEEQRLLQDASTDSAEVRERAYDRFVELLSLWANTIKRRELLRVLGWAASAVVAKPPYGGLKAEQQDRVMDTVETASRVDATIIDHIEGVLWRLIRQDDALGAQATLDTVVAQRNVVRLILPECPGPLRLRLLSLFSNYSLQAGWALYDLTDFDSANHYYEHARATAHEAENTELGALVLCTMSHLATWRGRPRIGIDHAVAAQGWAVQSNDPRLRAYAADVAARAFALDGQRAACMRELDIAEANLSARRDEPDQSRMYFYTPGQFAGTKSHCLLQLGDVHGAIRAGEESLALVDPSFVRNLAFTKLFLGDAYVAAKAIDQAASVIAEAAALALQNRSARLLDRLQSTRRQLNPWERTTAVRRLDEQLHACHLS